MLEASISKKERVGMSAPGALESDRLPSLGNTGNGRRFLTNSVNLQNGFSQAGGSMSVKGSKSGNRRTGTSGSIGS